MALDDNSNDFLKHAIKRAIVSDLINERIEAYKTELESLQKAEHNSDCSFSTNPDAVENCTCLAKAEPLSKPPVSQAQRAAMGAAANGNSTLDIPKKVGKEFINADKGKKLPVKKEEATPPDNSAGTNMFMKEKKVKKGEDYDDNNGRTVMSKVTRGAKVPASVAGKKKVNPQPPPNGLVPSQKIPDNNDAEVKTPGNKLPIKKADPMFLKEGKKGAVKKAQGGVAPPKAMKPVMPAKPQVGPMGATGGGGMGKTEGLDKAVLPQHKEAIRRDALQGAFQSAKQGGAAPAKATPAPKMPSPEEHAQRAAGLQDFMPAGKFTKQELGKCAYGCGKSEHLNECGDM